MEQHNIPSVPVVTTIFENSCRALARAQGYPAFPMVVIRHPVAYLEDKDLSERAKEAVLQVVQKLTLAEQSSV